MGPVPIVSAQETEQPNFSLLIQEGPIEVRKYTPMIVAQVTVSGERRRAMSGGFRVLSADFFGYKTSFNNTPLTAPAYPQNRDKTALTSPHTQPTTPDDF